MAFFDSAFFNPAFFDAAEVEYLLPVPIKNKGWLISASTYGLMLMPPPTYGIVLEAPPNYGVEES